MNFTNIIFGQYVARKSVIHRIDPRAKLISILLLLGVIISIKSSEKLFAAIIIYAVIVCLSKIGLKNLISSLKPVIYLVIFTLIFNVIFLTISLSLEAAIIRSFFLSVRLLLLMMYAIMLPMTTAPLELSDGLSELLKPFRKILPVEDISMMLGIALRFMPLLMEETDKIMKSQISRGAKFEEGNIFKRIKSFFPVMLPLFVIIFRRADELALAMEVRGYGLGQKRTRIEPLNWKVSDSIAILISVIIMIILLV